MELKNFFPLDDQGNAITHATCYLYVRGTESLATGLLKANGQPLSNPFETDQALVQFAAANGLYDLRVIGGARDYRIRLQFNDVAETAAAAQTAADRAMNSASVALTAKDISFDEPTGRLKKLDGEYFFAENANPNIRLTLWQRINAETSRHVYDHQNSKHLFSVVDAPEGYGTSFEDRAGGIAVAIEEDGTQRIAAAKIANLTAGNLTVEQASPGNARSDSDEQGHEAFAIRDDGMAVTDALMVREINGLAFDVLTGEAKPHFIADIWGVGNEGQSNAQGPTGAIHTVPVFDCLGFPAHATAPTAFLPMTAANVSWSGNQELPSFGALDCIKQLILSKLGIVHTAHSFTPVVMHTAYGGYTIAQLSKGTASWDQYVGMIQAAYNLAQAQGKTFAHMVNFWLQGEGDLTMSFAYYYSEFMRYHRERNEAARAITGQSEPVWTVASQMNANGANFVVPVAMATLTAADAHPNIVVACPTYFRQFLDDVHGDPASMELEGAYLGLAAFLSIIQRKKFQPLRAIASKLQGRVQEVTFNKTGLSLATSATVPAIAQKGFHMVTPGGTEIVLESVEVTQTNKVRFVWASIPPKGSRWWAGGKGIPAGIKGVYVGSCINLKDSQGDTYTYNGTRLDNWCVVHNIDPRGNN